MLPLLFFDVKIYFIINIQIISKKLNGKWIFIYWWEKSLPFFYLVFDINNENKESKNIGEASQDT